MARRKGNVNFLKSFSLSNILSLQCKIITIGDQGFWRHWVLSYWNQQFGSSHCSLWRSQTQFIAVTITSLQINYCNCLPVLEKLIQSHDFSWQACICVQIWKFSYGVWNKYKWFSGEELKSVITAARNSLQWWPSAPCGDREVLKVWRSSCGCQALT